MDRCADVATAVITLTRTNLVIEQYAILPPQWQYRNCMQNYKVL